MPKNGRGGGGGFSNRGRGRGGGAARGGGLGFVPFSGHGNTLGSGDISDPQPSVRGGGSGGRPFRGRGRGGNLSAQGQNRVAFDYAGLSQGRANATAEQQLDEDFVIEPHSRYKHKVTPHLENAQHSDSERKRAPLSNAQSSQIPAEAIAYASGSRDVNPKFRRGATPTSFPEFHTSRGANGYKQRPPEETEDARYLAGVPGIRRDQHRPSRFEPRVNPYGNPLRKPVTFVKALHKPDIDPLDEQQAQRKAAEEPAAQALEALQQTSHAYDPFGHSSSKHAGLGFSNKTEDKAHHAVPPPSANFVVDDAMEQDEVNALLAAFPGSKELGAGESMLDDGSAFDFMPMPSIITNKEAAHAPIHDQDEVVVTDIVQEKQEEDQTVHVKQEKHPLPESLTEPREFVESDSEEERQLDAILAQSRLEDVEAHEEDVEHGVESGEDVGFIIDLTGSAPTEGETVPAQQRDRVALGDILPPSAVQPSPGMQQKTRAPKKPRKRVPREGDSDLEWGSEGPPGQRDDGNDTDGEIVAAAAEISFRDAHAPPAAAEADQSQAQSRMLDELMLARAIRADRHGWDTSDHEMISVQSPSTKTRKRGGERAKRSMPNKAAGQRKAAETSRARKEHEAAAVADYLENIMNQQDDEDDDEQVDEILGQDHAEGSAKPANRTVLDIMSQFLHGMDPQKGGKQLSFGDVQDEINIAETKEWMTESEDESESDGPNEASIGRAEAARRQMSAIAARKQNAGQEEDPMTPERFEHDEDDEDLVEQLRVILMGESNSETDSGSPHPYSDDLDSEDSDTDAEDDDESDDDANPGSDESDSDSDSDESDDADDGMFQGKNSWADEDEEFIKALSAKMGPGKKSQKDVFKAISRGDFSEMVDDEMEIDSDDPAYGLGSVPTARNGKRKGRKWTDDDLWAEELQKQWDKDRASKAVRKQQRNMEKAAAALNPYPNTHGKMSKKAAKQIRRSEKRDARAALKAHGNNALAAIQAAGGIDAVDQGLLAFGGRGTDLSSIGLDQRFAFNMDELDEQIRMFLADRGKSTLTLQAMDKFARAEVHQLAAAYNLKSQSKGKGDNRFPTLIKTSRSGVNVNDRKVRRILLSNSGARFGNDAGRSDFKNKNKRLGKGARRMVGQDGGGAPAPRNREGEMVGYGADKIGADNIGHRLLAAMGWSEGMGIGHSGGMANPVAATVKITKGGLGF